MLGFGAWGIAVSWSLLSAEGHRKGQCQGQGEVLNAMVNDKKVRDK